jgi:hypothetical protein
MSKFTVLKPPADQHLAIPTAEGMVINFTFDLNDAQYTLADGNLQISLPQQISLSLNDLLQTAANPETAPILILPDQQIINTHNLLLSMGIDPETLSADKPAAEPENLTSGKLAQPVASLLAETVDMGSSTDKAGSAEGIRNLSRRAWLGSACLSIPSSSHLPGYQARLEVSQPSVKAGSRLKIKIRFQHKNEPEKFLQVIPEPCILYLAFIPLEASYDLVNFINFPRAIIYYEHVVDKIWEDDPNSGGYLLKLVLGPGHLAEVRGVPCLHIEMPVYENYLKGAGLEVVLAAVAGANLETEERLSSYEINILPNYQARVIYGVKGSPEALCLTAASLEISPPALAFRSLDYQAGDCVNIAEIMPALGPDSAYTFKQQGHHLIIKMFNAEHSKNMRLVLENTSLAGLLANNAFIAGNSFFPEREWLAYRYLNQQFVDEYAINEADIVMTSKTLLNAFLEDEDYAAMKIFLENLNQRD